MAGLLEVLATQTEAGGQGGWRPAGGKGGWRPGGLIVPGRGLDWGERGS